MRDLRPKNLSLRRHHDHDLKSWTSLTQEIFNLLILLLVTCVLIPIRTIINIFNRDYASVQCRANILHQR